MGSRKVKKMSSGGNPGEAAQQKVEEENAKKEDIAKKTREELDAVPFTERVKKVIKKVTGKASGGRIKGYASGGMPKAKKGRRGDGICSRGRTKGRMV